MRDAPPTYSVVIPAFNEARRIGPTLAETAAFFQATTQAFEIVVVDDGSEDQTSQVVMEWRVRIPEVRLIRLPANRGKGYAVRTGVLNASGRFILFADADAATPIGELARLQAAIDNGAQIAIGSRAKESVAVRVQALWYRRLIGRIFHALVRMLTVRGFVDTQCGFKLFTAGAAHDLFAHMRTDGFAFDVELLVIARIRGFHVEEVPVNWSHKSGSRVNLIWDSLAMARDLFVIRGNVIRGVYQKPHLRPLDQPPA